MKQQKIRDTPVIVIPKGYKLEDCMDLDNPYEDEKPIAQEEVKIRFERADK